VIVRACAVMALLAVATSVAAQSGHKAMGTEPGHAKIKHRDYRFEVTPPSEVYANMGWQHYRALADEGSTILVTGNSGYDTYALSVTSVPMPSDSIDPVELGKKRNPDMVFVTHSENPVCALTDPNAAPVPIGPGMVGFFAECVDAKSAKAYELAITWKSLLLHPQARQQAEAAGVAGSGDEFEPSPQFREAMDSFVASFRFR
jgi:hypothetical protein